MQSGSPCIDAGDNTAVPADVDTDLAGNPRFLDDPAAPDTGNSATGPPFVDMGAYEYRNADCNGNGVDDADDISAGTSADCDTNGIPDECEPDADCNSNSVTDICEIAAGSSPDCNFNRVPDECDILIEHGGFCDPQVSDCSTDFNGNGVPDECELGDLDGDGDVDIDDYELLSSCMAGPGGSYPDGCSLADFDGDEDVDLGDFAEFQRVFTGASP